MSADTGVGPAIASGSQTYSGICALLPAQPRKRKRQMAVITTPPNGELIGRGVDTDEVQAPEVARTG